MLLQACNVALPVYNKNYMYNTSILVQEMLQYNTMKNFFITFSEISQLLHRLYAKASHACRFSSIMCTALDTNKTSCLNSTRCITKQGKPVWVAAGDLSYFVGFHFLDITGRDFKILHDNSCI